MHSKDYYLYSSWCIKRNITIYPIPQKSNEYKIVVNRSGKEKVTKKVYPNKGYEKTIDVQMPSKKIIKKKVWVQSVWVEIGLLYKKIYDKNHNIIAPKAPALHSA